MEYSVGVLNVPVGTEELSDYVYSVLGVVVVHSLRSFQQNLQNE
jgi:hypothetical protein